MTPLTSVLVLLMAALFGMDFVDAFALSSMPSAFFALVPHRDRASVTVANKPLVAAPLFMAEDLFADIAVTVRTSDFHDTFGETAVDKNGKEFTVGCVVRVCKDGLKAFQINVKGQGAYDDDKNFVPDVSDERKKCLVLPSGLRGTVTKVYDENVVSANYPIQVKFTPGTNTEEGYDIPTALLMHFMPQELECV